MYIYIYILYILPGLCCFYAKVSLLNFVQTFQKLPVYEELLRNRCKRLHFYQIGRSKDAQSNVSSLPRLSGIPVKLRLPQTRTADNEVRLKKRSTQLKQLHCRGTGRRRRLEFECLEVKFVLLCVVQDAGCNSGVCK